MASSAATTSVHAGSVGGREPEDGFAAIGGVIGGAVGTVAIVLALLGIDALAAGSTGSPFAAFAGGTAAFLGILVFFAAGSLSWPLLFVAIAEHLPGERRSVQGAIFGMVFWVGFVGLLVWAYPPAGLPVVIPISAVAHLGYGTILGTAVDRFSAPH